MSQNNLSNLQDRDYNLLLIDSKLRKHEVHVHINGWYFNSHFVSHIRIHISYNIKNVQFLKGEENLTALIFLIVQASSRPCVIGFSVGAPAAHSEQSGFCSTR